MFLHWSGIKLKKQMWLSINDHQIVFPRVENEYQSVILVNQILKYLGKANPLYMNPFYYEFLKIEFYTNKRALIEISWTLGYFR